MEKFLLEICILGVFGELFFYHEARKPEGYRTCLGFATLFAVGVAWTWCYMKFSTPSEPGPWLTGAAILAVVITAVVLVYHLFCWLNVFPRQRNIN